MSSQLLNHLVHLKDEIALLKSRIQPEDCGHLHTTVNVLEERVEEIKKELERHYDD